MKRACRDHGNKNVRQYAVAGETVSQGGLQKLVHWNGRKCVRILRNLRFRHPQQKEGATGTDIHDYVHGREMPVQRR